jgi:hypothetical protein
MEGGKGGEALRVTKVKFEDETETSEVNFPPPEVNFSPSELSFNVNLAGSERREEGEEEDEQRW